MSKKEAKETTKEQPETEGQSFAAACPCMTAGDLPDCCPKPTSGEPSPETSGCCGPEMQGMMARMMSAFQSPAE
jgi:hypothetical protein